MNYRAAVDYIESYIKQTDRLFAMLPGKFTDLRGKLADAVTVLKSMGEYGKETDLPSVRESNLPEWLDSSRRH